MNRLYYLSRIADHYKYELEKAKKELRESIEKRFEEAGQEDVFNGRGHIFEVTERDTVYCGWHLSPGQLSHITVNRVMRKKFEREFHGATGTIQVDTTSNTWETRSGQMRGLSMLVKPGILSV